MSRYLTLGDVRLVLVDMLENKLDLLNSTMSFKIYEPALVDRRDRIVSVHKALEGKPLAEELKDTDRLHDSIGRAIHLICTGLAQLVTLDGEKRRFAQSVLDTFAPSLGALQKSYEDEAAAAAKRRPELDAMAPELKSFPAAPDMTLYSLVSDHLDAGEKIDKLLSRRATATADDEAARSAEAVSLRAETIGLLGRFRSALSDEAAIDAELSRDVVGKVFAYYDQLADSRDDRADKPDKPATDA